MSEDTALVADHASHLTCDEALLYDDAVLSVSGWALAEGGVRSIEIAWGGQHVGVAHIGVERPDVARVWPHWVGADRAGFTFCAPVDLAATDGALTLELAGVSGLRRTLRVAPAAAGRAFHPPAATPDMPPPLRVFVDEPKLADGRAVEAIRASTVLINGWALAANGVADIDVFCDDVPLGRAYVGMRREDIAAAFPDEPGALLSGFVLSVPRSVIGEGEHTFRVRLRANDGATCETAFAAEIVRAERVDGPDFIRRRVTQAEIATKERVLAASGIQPYFAVLLHADDGPDVQSRVAQTLASVAAQTHPRWSAFLHGPGAPARGDPTWDAMLGSAGRHGAVHILDGEAHDLRSLAGSDGSTSPWICTLEAGDELGADALTELALAAALNRGADFFYADERRSHPTGTAPEAFLKPAWSPQLLLSSNYIGRPWIASVALCERAALGPRDLGTGGAHELVLRLTEAADGVGHVPLVLLARGACAERNEDGAAAVTRALARRGVQAEVRDGLVPATWDLRPTIDADAFVSVIIPTIAARGLIEACIASIRAHTPRSRYELIVVDNLKNPADPWKAWLRDRADRIVETTEPFNWSRFNNLGAAVATGNFLLFLNDDIEAHDDDWLERLIAVAQDPAVGAVGPQLLYPDGKVQHAGLFLSGEGTARHAFRFLEGTEPGYFGLARTQRNVIGVTGACLLVRRAVFDEVGGFDEAHPVVNNDLDFCLRCWRAGYENVFTPFVSLTHHELASRASIADTYDHSAFAADWGSVFASGDPFFHKLLSTGSDGYGLELEPTRAVFPGHPIYNRADIARILVVKLDHIGDFITGLPAIFRLRALFPQAWIGVLVGRACEALARSIAEIDSVDLFDFFHARSGDGPRIVPEAEMFSLGTRLAAQRVDLAIDLRKHPDTRDILRLSRAKVFAGFDTDGRFPWLDISLEWEGDARFAPKRHHISDDLLHLIGAIDVAGLDRSSVIETDPARLDELIDWGVLPDSALRRLFTGPTVCVHPAAGTPMRQWPARNFARLIDLLVETENARVIIVGGPDDRAIVDAITAEVRNTDHLHSAVGKTSLGQLPRLLAACDLFVGNNSGPHHMAAALGVPTIGIHSGVVDAREWGPIGSAAVAIRREMTCSPCYLSAIEDCHRGLACLRDLPPSAVFDECRVLLGARER